MAWVDDRIWCHPKFTGLSDRALAVWVKGLAYAAGMSTRGHLTRSQQRLIGATPKVKNELIFSRLWDENGDDDVRIHDWDEHNGKRDERRAADRERKRLARAKERPIPPAVSAGQSAGRSTGQSAGQSNGTTAGRSTGPAHVDGSEGSDGSEEDQEPSFLPLDVARDPDEEGRQEPEAGYTPQELDELAGSLLADMPE